MLCGILVGNVLIQDPEHTLGHRVGSPILLPAPGMGGTGQDDASSAVQPHVFDRLLATEESSFVVDRGYPVEGFFVAGVQRAHRGHAGIVEKAVDLSKLFVSRVKQVLAVFHLQQVGVDEDPVGAVGPDIPDGFLPGLLIPAADNHLGPFPSGHLSKSPPDALCPAGNNDHFIA